MDKINPTLRYSCKIFNVWEEEIVVPTGKHVKQNWIDHKPTVAVTALNDHNEILLIKQYRNAIKKTIWEIPAGTVDSIAEAPDICAQRELAEETGFKAGTMIKLFEGYLLPGYCNEYMYFFLGRNLVADPLPPDEDEFIETIPLSLTTAKKMLQRGDIIDAKTALGIILTDQFLNKQRA